MSHAVAELHGGTAGVADTAFFGAIDGFLRRTAAPAEVVASMQFLQGLSSWNFALAAKSSELLVARARAGEMWLDPDLIRDGATTARIMQGDIVAARQVFRGLAEYSRRDPADARTLLLESYLD